ncbi:hypothetical protein [Pinibacter aurantiacus]|uniref:Uncharacterized protein n=1 Tax=Pinibacter aurantiacus TaxID=2851599 RepID=A0A9E2W666_9BACT|nr:hypothetical protein [Pinibacter aurantiacus]MBV4359734.1 hypothetical protein [Pinibacter aurantiacus]
MKAALKTSVILSWINLVVSCGCVLLGLILSGIVGPKIGFVAVVLFGAIGLHSYESLRLRNCIVYNAPMDKKTPLSLQVMGFIAIFFSFVTIRIGFDLFRNAKEVAKENKKMFVEHIEQYEKVNFELLYQMLAVGMVIFGLAVLVNVLISMSLLRWYKSQDENQNPE